MDNWIYGLALVALTLAIHAAGVTYMVTVLRGIRIRLQSRNLRLPRVFAIVVGAITAMGLLLAALHGIEAAFWAAAYLWLGALGSAKTAILYSVDAMATRGASGLTLQSHWQMMGALEAADGMLLFGISTAFIFSVMQFYNEHLVFRALPGGATGPEPEQSSKVRFPMRVLFSPKPSAQRDSNAGSRKPADAGGSRGDEIQSVPADRRALGENRTAPAD